ncbi:response regulator [Oleiharenicola sp. Vm1]|uniref:response regulator n=1 Tax=Oleiharenicola sp. Vm1 TaxID=3398393 RepID=UPI0039F49CAD
MLLLDDEVQLTVVMTRMLEAQFEIEVAASVEEARLLLGTRQFDALVCDHMMPGPVQGLDFLVEAMTVQPNAKRILMTGYMNPELLARGVTLAQLSGVLLKPCSLQHIRKALHDALGLSA